MSDTPPSSSFIRTFKDNFLSSIPALAGVTFAAIKVFRTSGMEASTTVAIVSTADVVALLKGVVLTLLPGFLAGLIGASIWWWATSIPEGSSRHDAKKALLNPDFAMAWILVVVGFFTITWPVFLFAFFLPMVVSSAWLLWRAAGRGKERSTRLLKGALKILGASGAVISILYLTLAPTVWLPLRSIEVQPGQTVTLGDTTLTAPFAAYVLSSDDSGASLLLESPRAVVEVPSGVIVSNPPICIPPPSPNRRFFLRPSQILHMEPDPGSPYPVCP